MAPPPSPAPQPGFLWVRPWGGRCVLAPRTHQDRQGRSQRAASPHPEEPAAPEGARLADCTTAQVGSSAPHHPGFLEATEAEDSHDCAWVGVRGKRPAWEPCRWGAPASTPWGYQRWDLGLSTSPYQINQPHTCDHTCKHVDTVYVHPRGPRARTRTHTHTSS